MTDRRILPFIAKQFTPASRHGRQTCPVTGNHSHIVTVHCGGKQGSELHKLGDTTEIVRCAFWSLHCSSIHLLIQWLQCKEKLHPCNPKHWYPANVRSSVVDSMLGWPVSPFLTASWKSSSPSKFHQRGEPFITTQVPTTVFDKVCLANF